MAQDLRRHQPSQAFTVYAWLCLAYLVGVILFGAWVRITGSGAGCGSHWPTCNGVLIPADPSAKTVIEYTHRITSGLCGIIGLVLIGWSVKLRGYRDRMSIASYVTMLFILVEGAIGAKLVLSELVADNASTSRAVVISLHLVNTLALAGSAALVAWWSQSRVRRAQAPSALPTWMKAWGVGMVVALVVTSMTGAITALGDTLFPTQAVLGEGLLTKVTGDMSTANHFLVRLRIAHPVVAITTAASSLFLGAQVLGRATRPQVRRLAMVMMAFVSVQTLLGFMNIALAAPGWMQIIHLLVAQGVWVSMVLLVERMLSDRATAGQTPEPASAGS